MTSVITGDLPTHRSRVHEASVKASLAKLSLDQAIVMYQRRECTVLLTCGLCFSLRYFRTDRKSAIVTGKILLSHQHGSCFWNLIKTINWIKLEYSVSPSLMGKSINFAFWYLEPSIFWPLCTLWCPLPLPSASQPSPPTLCQCPSKLQQYSTTVSVRTKDQEVSYGCTCYDNILGTHVPTSCIWEQPVHLLRPHLDVFPKTLLLESQESFNNGRQKE